MPNPWDAGSAKVLVALGFAALATTSGGFAGTLGRLDGSLTREEALAHAASMAESVAVPVSADLENCFDDDPEGVAATVRLAAATGLAGCSVEDHGPDWPEPIYERALARERVTAAGVARISVGSAFASVARGALIHAAEELRDAGTHGWAGLAAEGSRLARSAFAE